LHRLAKGSLVSPGRRAVDRALGHSDGDVRAMPHRRDAGRRPAVTSAAFSEYRSAMERRGGLTLSGPRCGSSVTRDSVSSADVTVILERPKLASHLDGIRRGIGRPIGYSVDQISVRENERRR